MLRRWPELATEVAAVTRCRSAVIDGEICCLDANGCSDFYGLMFRREHPCFYAFDVLALDGTDVTSLRLLERKKRLRRIVPAKPVAVAVSRWCC